MANEWIESFDNVSTATAPLKGWAFASGPTITSSAVRTGSQGMRLTGTSQTVSKSITSTNEIYFGFGVRFSGFSASSTIFAWLVDPESGSAQVSLYITTSGQIQARMGTATVLATSTEVIPVGAFAFVEVHAIIHNTTGVVEVKLNEATIISVSGVDTQQHATSNQINGLKFQGLNSLNLDIDDVYVNNTSGSAHNGFEGDHGVYLLSPNGNGASSDLVGSDSNSTDNYLLVDETTSPSSADYVGSAVDNDHDSYTFTDLAGTMTVSLVQISIYAAKTDVGQRSFAPMVRSGGTDDTGIDQSLSNIYQYYQYVYEQNPVTDAPWTQAEVNAAEFGFKVRP